MGTANGRKSIFITGAASGMGRETARLFREKGWFIGGYDVNADGLRALEKELGADNCVVRRLDVTDKADYEKALAEFGAATGGKMDILYNNAGIGVGGFFDEQPFEDILRVVRVNFIGVLNGIHSAIGLLKATPGSLCFTTSSSSATYGMPGIAVYSATKHAVKGSDRGAVDRVPPLRRARRRHAARSDRHRDICRREPPSARRRKECSG